jgi:GDPmannose 4,6-dehydratase
MEDTLYLGNLNAQRDWGHARDYVEGMYRMLQQEKAADYVLATGITTSVRDFATMAFAALGVTLAFEGEDIDEIGRVTAINPALYPSEVSKPTQVGAKVIAIDPRYFRPAEVDLLVGDATKAKEELGWIPQCTLKEMVEEMIHADLQYFRREQWLAQNGFPAEAAKE